VAKEKKRYLCKKRKKGKIMATISVLPNLQFGSKEYQHL